VAVRHIRENWQQS